MPLEDLATEVDERVRDASNMGTDYVESAVEGVEAGLSRRAKTTAVVIGVLFAGGLLYAGAVGAGGYGAYRGYRAVRG